MKENEIEMKKLEIEELKIKDSLFRTLVIVLLTVGAGIGTIAFRLNVGEKIELYLLVILVLLFILILWFVLSLWLSIRKKQKEIEKWLRS